MELLENELFHLFKLFLGYKQKAKEVGGIQGKWRLTEVQKGHSGFQVPCLVDSWSKHDGSECTRAHPVEVDGGDPNDDADQTKREEDPNDDTCNKFVSVCSTRYGWWEYMSEWLCNLLCIANLPVVQGKM
ncbi:hypothetical protein RHMOL_Rhmol06G0266300 [Rhododendron molle]|uniref:Uncharacterized protein n=1 Tax=Rhododendron molle TaxID=49168 RepID=A0ACC0NIL9_RHOML|nr:hypothetical protein RHMOL_Rhmol06G0266300 [Rhododendron molle]